MEKILNNNEMKQLFLRAIILGINYGKSNKSDYYLDNIQKELAKLDTPNDLILKYENNIKILDSQKNNTLTIINNLSTQNYTYNYPKINFLKNNLLLINKEILKNQFIIKKLKDNGIHNIFNNIINKPVENNIVNNTVKENLVDELEKTLGNLSTLFI